MEFCLKAQKIINLKKLVFSSKYFYIDKSVVINKENCGIFCFFSCESGSKNHFVSCLIWRWSRHFLLPFLPLWFSWQDFKKKFSTTFDTVKSLLFSLRQLYQIIFFLENHLTFWLVCGASISSLFFGLSPDTCTNKKTRESFQLLDFELVTQIKSNKKTHTEKLACDLFFREIALETSNASHLEMIF